MNEELTNCPFCEKKLPVPHTHSTLNVKFSQCIYCDLYILDEEETVNVLSINKLDKTSKIKKYIKSKEYLESDDLPDDMSLITDGLNCLDKDENVCAAFYSTALYKDDTKIDDSIYVLFTNKRILSCGKQIFELQYSYSNFKNNYIISDEYKISCNCKKSFKKLFDKLIVRKKEIQESMDFQKYLEQNKQNLTQDIQDYVKKIIISNYEQADEYNILSKVESSYNIYYDNIPKNTTEKFYLKYISQKISVYKKIVEEIKDYTKSLIKENKTDDEINALLVSKYNIDSEVATNYINKVSNIITNELNKEKSDQRKKYVKSIAYKNDFNEDIIVEEVQKKYDISKNRIIKDINELKENSKDYFYDSAENILITNEGNVFKAIKEMMDKYNLTKEEAKEYINKSYKAMTNTDEETKSNQQTQNIFSSTTYHTLDEKKPSYTENSRDYGPTCPNCGSSNIHKIGVINRAVSIGVLGLASSKIGKTQKCDKCGYTW